MNGLGFTAKSSRRISSGSAYNSLFPPPKRTEPILNKDGSVTDTVGLCKKIVLDTLSDTKAIAQVLKKTDDNGKINIGRTAEAIFNFIYTHIQYEIDKPGVEQLRRPARTWADRKGDCDCMSIFASSILTNLGIPHAFRIVKMYGRNYFQHIYVVVPTAKDANRFYIIDPVLDEFDKEAPKINFKKDFEMKNNLSGIPIQYLNGPRNINIPKWGQEFNDFDGLSGTGEELSNAWHKRMKAHLVNTHNAITQDPRRVSALYDPKALAAAYKELIGVWDSEHAREGALDRLSNAEENFLRPEFRGLGDIIHGDDDRLFGMINADLNSLAGLGKSKKAEARKAAKAAKAPAKKRGPITKIKNASKKVKAAAKKSAAKVKEVAKKVSKGVVKGTTTPVRVGILSAMKINFGKLGSRAYWGMFPQAEAAEHGVLPDYWNSANKLWEKLRKVFVDKLKGDEKVLRKSIISGRAAKVAKRGTHGLGSISEVFTNGLAQIMGFSGLGEPAEVAAIITAAGGVLVPLVAYASKDFKGKKISQGAVPDDGSDKDDGSDSDVPGAATNVEDNYNNEVAESQPAQEPEADGSVQEDTGDVSGEREYQEGIGDLGKKIKSKKGSATQKRIKKDKVNRKAEKTAKKAAKKAKPYKSPLNAKEVELLKRAGLRKGIPLSTLNQMKPAEAKKLIKEQKKFEAKNAHKANAEKNKKMKLKDLVAKLRKSKSYASMSPAQLEQEAIKIKNKTPEQIVADAEAYATNKINEEDTSSSSAKNDSSSPSTPSVSPEGASKAEEAPAPSADTSKEKHDEQADPVPSGIKDADGLDVYQEDEQGRPPKDLEPNQGYWDRPRGVEPKGGKQGYVWKKHTAKKSSSESASSEEKEESEGMSTGAKVGIAALALGLIYGASKMKGKKKEQHPATSGLGKSKDKKVKTIKIK